ncbi:MAG: co-chaperone GroES [Candidatus Woesebacteria bacterium]|nr:MAG: co-chaperone GroES [Candidatus Woesebacteria bacterium]
MPKNKSKKINLIPTAGYLLIKQDEDSKKTSGGIYLPDTATTEKPQKGKVIAIGTEEILENGTKRKSPAKIGDTVIYKKWGGNEVKLDDLEYLFVKFDDVLAVVV